MTKEALMAGSGAGDPSQDALHAGRRWRRFASLSSLVAIAALVGASAAAAGPVKPGDQQTISANATWAEAMASNWSCDPSAFNYDYKVDFVIPGTVLAGDGPTRAGEADLRKPWVSFTERRFRWPAGGCNEQGTIRDVEELCAPWLNTDDFRFTADPLTGTARLSVDVRCDDGRGFDFYRVTWNREGGSAAAHCNYDRAYAQLTPACEALMPAWQLELEKKFWDEYGARASSSAAHGGWAWGSWNPGSWGGGITDVSSSSTRGLGAPTICGHSAAGVQCLKGVHTGWTAAYGIDQLYTYAQQGD
jgi:hypothetical protein